MKVRIDMTVDIDADEWAWVYGLTKAEVRDDVREAIKVAVQSMPVPPGNVSVRGA